MIVLDITFIFSVYFMLPTFLSRNLPPLHQSVFWPIVTSTQTINIPSIMNSLNNLFKKQNKMWL